MSRQVKVYKGNPFYSMPILIFPVLLTVIAFLEGLPFEKGELIGLLGFWIISIVLIAVPFGAKLEIGEDFVRSQLFGIKLMNLHTADIQNLQYGKLFRGGLGYGKGINISALHKGKSKH